uniref:WD repeat-containing protein 91 n=1 Tax=Saccoglossus kowalevskii TaxID=10224 RepID=A0ABM0M0C2_SACKO|nr:PREDICTED: WD repeat-containing protein 91-like [Saccoglossus kowalevskii]
MGSSNCIVKLFDTEAKRTLHEVPTDKLYPRITSLCCSPLGSSFVCSATKPNILSAEQTTLSEYHSASNIKAGKLWYWDMKTMKILREVPIELHTACINSTQFNHNGHLLVTGGSDGAVRLYDMHRYDCIMSWKAHNGPVYSVQFSPDENSVYSMGADGKFINWSIHDTGRRLLRDLSVHDGATGPFIVSGYSGYRQVHTPKGKLFAFDVEGCHVLTCASNGGVIYKLSDIGLSRTLTLLGHRAPVVSVDWSSAMNCGMCLTGSMDGRIRVTTILSQ